MPGYGSQQRAYEIVLDGIGLRVLPDANGVPIWNVQSVPAIAGESVQIAEEEAQWLSWHGGFGYAYKLADNCYHYAVNADLRFPRTMILGPYVTAMNCGGNVTAFFEQSSSLYVCAGQYVQRVDLTGDYCDTTNEGSAGKDMGTGKTVYSAENWDGRTAVWIGNSDAAWEFDGTTWAQATGNNIRGKYSARFWAETYNALARTDETGYSVRWLSEATRIDAAGWTAAYVVGDNGSAITALTAVGETILVAKTDGLYSIDRSTRTPRHVPIFTVDANNGKNTIADSSGYAWMPTIEGYYRYNAHDGEVLDCTPGIGLPNESPIYGRITCQVQYKGWRYVAVYNGIDSYILCGRPREDGESGVGPMLWHGALYKLTHTSTTHQCEITAMWLTSLTTPPRLYFGARLYNGDADTDLTTYYVRYLRLPSNGDNPLLDSDYRYSLSGSVYLSADDWNSPGSLKDLSGFEIDNENVSSTTFVDIYAQLDHASGWQLVRSMQAPGRSTIGVPIEGDWLFRQVAVRLDITNQDYTNTPKIRSIVGKATRRPYTRDLIQTKVACGNEVPSRQGLYQELSGADVIARLKRLEISGSVLCSDYWTGEKRDLRVRLLPIKQGIVKQKNDEAALLALDLSMLVLDGNGQIPVTYTEEGGIYDTSVYDEAVYGGGLAKQTVGEELYETGIYDTSEYGSAVYGTV